MRRLIMAAALSIITAATLTVAPAASAEDAADPNTTAANDVAMTQAGLYYFKNGPKKVYPTITTITSAKTTDFNGGATVTIPGGIYPGNTVLIAYFDKAGNPLKGSKVAKAATYQICGYKEGVNESWFYDFKTNKGMIGGESAVVPVANCKKLSVGKLAWNPKNAAIKLTNGTATAIK